MTQRMMAARKMASMNPLAWLNASLPPAANAFFAASETRVPGSIPCRNGRSARKAKTTKTASASGAPAAARAFSKRDFSRTGNCSIR
mgnify:CR=1 FL=1